MDRGIVVYAGKKVSLGIDVHVSFFVVSVVCEGVKVKQCRIAGRGEAVKEFISRFFWQASEVQSCYEAGYSGFWLHRYLVSEGIKNIVVHPASVEIEARNRIKTDKRDSLKLAIQLDAGRLKGIRVPSIEEEQRRLVTRTREQLMNAKRRVRTQIRMKLHQFGLVPVASKECLTETKIREVLLNTTVSEELKLGVSVLLKQWGTLDKELKSIQKVLAQQARTDPLEAVYRSIPGVGPIAARVLSNELGDMSQFPNERVLFSFTGLTPGEYSSGEKVYRGHISRQGSSRLRHILVEAAWVSIRKDTSLAQAFSRIARTRGKKRAIVAVARKLVGRIRAVLKTHGTCTEEVLYKKVA